MKKLILISMLVSGLTACSNQSANSGSAASNAEIESLKKDVEQLKADIYGVELGTCETANVLDGLNAYADTMKDLPDTDLDASDWHKANGERETVLTAPSGLQYTIVRAGKTDEPKPRDTDIIEVNYHGTFVDGKTFDSSYERGTPLEFQTNGVIKGWIEAMKDMRPCEASHQAFVASLGFSSNSFFKSMACCLKPASI